MMMRLMTRIAPGRFAGQGFAVSVPIHSAAQIPVTQISEVQIPEAQVRSLHIFSTEITMAQAWLMMSWGALAVGFIISVCASVMYVTWDIHATRAALNGTQQRNEVQAYQRSHREDVSAPHSKSLLWQPKAMQPRLSHSMQLDSEQVADSERMDSGVENAAHHDAADREIADCNATVSATTVRDDATECDDATVCADALCDVTVCGGAHCDVTVLSPSVRRLVESERWKEQHQCDGVVGDGAVGESTPNESAASEDAAGNDAASDGTSGDDTVAAHHARAALADSASRNGTAMERNMP